MLRVRQIKVPIENGDVKSACAKKIKVKPGEIENLKIHKKSIDARDKNNVFYVYEVDIDIKNEQKILKKCSDVIQTPDETYHFFPTGNKKIKNRIVVIGTGPAGLFCAYMLALNGYKPLIVERGSIVSKRLEKVEKFWNDGILDLNSNIQFGEGGAGTFSDGKLGTLVSDKMHRMRKVFEILCENGAKKEILYENKPHVGTDELQRIVVNIRKKIESLGGEFRFDTMLTDIVIENDKIKSIIVNDSEKIEVTALVLAIGHSARETFLMLNKKGLEMKNKPFAVGFRVMHEQKFINECQYGEYFSKLLPPASYKLTYTSSVQKGVYSFCMCPGGYVVNSSSENGMTCVNGMSYSNRNSKIANSAIVVTVDETDYGQKLFDGMYFQRDLEQKNFILGNGSIPVSNVEDYLNNLKSTHLLINPCIKGKYILSNLNGIYNRNIELSLKEGLNDFNKKMPGFISKNAILCGVETRTSSPIRIIRNENLVSNIDGIYPCGEGAGYAGGITSAAMDGIKVFEAIASVYSKNN